MRYSIPKNKRDDPFAQFDDIRAHLVKEKEGYYLCGVKPMWHGGTHLTIPWCALTGTTDKEKIDFPAAIKIIVRVDSTKTGYWKGIEFVDHDKVEISAAIARYLLRQSNVD